jgi:hypothetical protein
MYNNKIKINQNVVVISLKARESKPVLECARVVIKRERENKKRERESG